MKFANNDTKVGVTLSDIYVGGMMLARVQAERQFNAIIELQRMMNSIDETGTPASEKVDEQSPTTNLRAQLLNSGRMTHRRSILTIQNDDGGGCIVVPKNVLAPSNPDDVEILRNAAHYSKYAECAYFYIQMALVDLLPKDATKFIRDFDKMSPMPCFSLQNCDVPYAQLFYSNFYNGITATPYSILVDDMEKSVVITVRGTKSLEGKSIRTTDEE